MDTGTEKGFVPGTVPGTEEGSGGKGKKVSAIMTQEALLKLLMVT